MNVIQALRALGPIDIRSVRRDSALSWMAFIPLLSALLLRWGTPPLTERLLERYGFDLAPYYPVMLGYFFVVMSPVTFAVLTGFLLLDEKDDHTLTALQVTPLSLRAYLGYRVAILVALTIVMMFIIFPLSALNALPWQDILLIGLTAAPLSPMFALFLASLAQNKVQGFALMKLAGAVLFAPILAYFTDAHWELLFGVVPTYWPMKVYWLLESGQREGLWIYAALAVVYPALLTAFFIRKFQDNMSR